MKILKIFSILIFLCATIHAQVVYSGATDSVRSVFSEVILNKKAFTDTNRVIMFSLKVGVEVENRTTNISSVEVSDSIAYQIFESFDFLSKIDYRTLMNEKKSAIFIFPVAIFLTYPGKEETGLLSTRSVSSQLISYMFLKDRNGNIEPTYKYIYIPALHIETSTLEDY
ncbi:MAG: hypothetical protein EOO43_07405 [Flavobacterium sp.]|nr:MAG: hypothetical protein EOO43_07405 [Flavobacterium sp.]